MSIKSHIVRKDYYSLTLLVSTSIFFVPLVVSLLQDQQHQMFHTHCLEQFVPDSFSDANLHKGFLLLRLLLWSLKAALSTHRSRDFTTC